jgi:autotransporter-associated beta strand protein
VTGAVYDYAQAKFDGAALDFGYVHQGATVSSQNVAIGNKTITNASYQDKLDVSGSSNNASVSVTGFTGLAASTNGSSTSNLAVGVDSSTLGTLNGTLSLTLTSNANGVLGLSNGDATRSGSGNITTTGTVYSGQATWNTDGSGSWGKVSSGFGSNWGANQGSPGLDSGFTNTDTATFGSAITSDATVSLNGASPKLKSITFNNTNASYTLATGSSGDITLNAGASDSAATIAVTGNHTISAVLKGSSQIDKTGSGTLTLSGVNTYTGLTNVTNGTLNLASTGSIASSDVAVSKAATLKATNSAISDSAIVGGITLNSGALVDLTSGSLKATSLTVGALSGSDVTKISYTIGNSLALTGGLTLNGNLSIDLLSNISAEGTYNVLSYAGSLSGLGQITLVSHTGGLWGDWNVTGNLDTTNNLYTIKVAAAYVAGGSPTSGTVTIPSGGSLGDISGTATVTSTAPASITGTISGGTVNLSGSGSSVNSVASGTVKLTGGTSSITEVKGDAAVEISGTNNTIGEVKGGVVDIKGATTVTTISSGVVKVNDDVTVTTLSGGDLTLGSGKTLTVSDGNSAGTIAGSGTLAKTGAGTLVLSGDNSGFTGATQVGAGTVQVTDIKALGSTSGVTLGFNAGTDAKLQIAATGDVTLNTNIVASNTTGANVLQNSGTGTLTVAGNLTKNGTVLTLAGNMNVTGNIIGAANGSDLVVLPGVVTISSNNSYNGPTFIQNGATLIANSTSATGNGVVNIANGGKLQVGTAANILTLTTGGFALSNGAHIKVYVDHIDITGLTSFVMDGVTHYNLSNTAGSAYSTLFTSGAIDVSGVTAGGITIDVYSSNANTAGLLRKPFYDFKFLEFGSVTGLGSGLNIS